MGRIAPGQTLSSGYDGVDLEFFLVARLGSIEASEPVVRDHPELSPVKLVRVSKGAFKAATSSNPGLQEARRPPRKTAHNLDLEWEPPTGTITARNRKLNWPTPYPIGHTDVAQWGCLFLNNIAISKPHNHDRERIFWASLSVGGDFPRL